MAKIEKLLNPVIRASSYRQEKYGRADALRSACNTGHLIQHSSLLKQLRQAYQKSIAHLLKMEAQAGWGC